MENKSIKSDRSIQSFKPTENQYTVRVDGCKKLFLLIRPDTKNSTNRKSWLYRYKHPITQKSKNMSFGEYPAVSLAEVRQKWLNAENQLAQGIDPKEKRDNEQIAQKSAIENSYQKFSKLHYNSIKDSQSESTLKRKLGRYKLICDYVGDLPIDSITPPQMLEVLLDIQKNSLNKDGKPTDKAERCAGIASEVFTYAGARGYCQYDPTSMIKSQLKPYSYGHRPAIVQPQPFGILLHKFNNLECDPSIVNAFNLLSLLFVRNGDLRRAKWADIELKESKWYLTPMKGRGRENMVKEMVIPLPIQAINILENQHKMTGHKEQVFYSQSAKKHGIMSENTVNNYLKQLGYQGTHCAHGFRASAKTMLQEQLKYQAVLVEMALGHTTKDQNGTAYGRFEFYDDRQKMMQHWADYLDQIRGQKNHLPDL